VTAQQRGIRANSSPGQRADEVVSAPTSRPATRFVHGVARRQLRIGVVSPERECDDNLESVDIRKLQVEHDGVRGAQLDRLERAEAVLDSSNVVVLHAQGASEGATNRPRRRRRSDVGVC